MQNFLNGYQTHTLDVRKSKSKKKQNKTEIMIIIIIIIIKMKGINFLVKVKDSQKEITHKHEGKPDIYSDQFSASGHLFFHTVFP